MRSACCNFIDPPFFPVRGSAATYCSGPHMDHMSLQLLLALQLLLMMMMGINMPFSARFVEVGGWGP